MLPLRKLWYHFRINISGKKQLAVCAGYSSKCAVLRTELVALCSLFFRSNCRGKSLNDQLESLNKDESEKCPTVGIDIYCSE